MRITSSENFRKMDNYSIENIGIPSIMLMENAALKVVSNIDLQLNNRFVIVCGRGNNGGDGLAVARHLHCLNKEVEVFIIEKSKSSTKDFEINYNILKNMNLNIKTIRDYEDLDYLRDSIIKSDMTVDAIFGIGLSRKIEGIYKDTISVINENSKGTLAIDIPSGLNANTGEVEGVCIEANITVSFEMYKEGFLTYDRDKYLGNIIIESIGIPREVLDLFSNDSYIIDKYMFKNNFKERNKYAHKGDFGKVLVIAGSKGFSGAAYLCTEAAVKSGTGLVTLATSNDIQNILSSKLEEAMTLNYENYEDIKNIMGKSNCIAIGPGMGKNNNTEELLRKIIRDYNGTMVIDADGINVLESNLDIIKNAKCKIVLTPHLGEFSRITGYDIDYIKKNRLKLAKEFAKENKIVLLLKGYNTIITNGKEVFVNSTGNSAMASGGMGDCLTGIIVSFIAQGYNPLEATCLAAYLHGYCGEKLSLKMFCVNATHILNYIPFAIKELQNIQSN
ncbi:bifunctional ADP-dependent NAD(P)H-hydrate dehydratase/NAD(P)H-hydrate epimerase [Clostridium botulinum]|uniref:bifunctional ADP-dependent NAD(P)H-hydrate dehydratase/NAD(P)H-hydrate epimerase n=1 Tax=Clostridium TaxID=1485 RepID=UPI0005F94C90|nr:bifunctional ADP-dependent NAD(P)H-hydrate dehydratase/NAD(P)H-hydrate epimerase [Clostridium sporogenes]EKO1913955.1 bifunctional ADP-dependent NAD(P)H-hydrate dehydratase/NAD(P)H-hydrate epimerase [Clostridium botulinum]EKO1914563.1 bifunctional ADP-dependent NAD(P)H-hydrate dehydratase/NAD(P)H-hydrate epimerase [Clostridium botulinum]EKO2044010.1 bifunctional ADP-dependent NAD(P)H-hydrate dehydratase/NAD(P)H-hydrate epimerase [Clostridium botulinum]EKO2044643.1 bifunctional ADP-dependent 